MSKATDTRDWIDATEGVITASDEQIAANKAWLADLESVVVDDMLSSFLN